MNPLDTNSLLRRDFLKYTAAAVLIKPGISSAQNITRTDRKKKPPVTKPGFDLDRFIENCRTANQDADSQHAVKEVLSDIMASPQSVLSTVGEPELAGIKTLYRSTALTILNIVWSPLMQLMPHEHNMWALIGIYTGREDNIFWKRTEHSIEARSAVSLHTGGVYELAGDVIHSVINPVPRLTGAIHIYGGDFFAVPRSEWDPDDLRESAWDIDKAKRMFKESNERFLAWKSCSV